VERPKILTPGYVADAVRGMRQSPKRAGANNRLVHTPDPLRLRDMRPRRYLPRVNTPKADRVTARPQLHNCRRPLGPVGLMMLGHPPRGRKGAR